jgi:hypothetical protein
MGEMKRQFYFHLNWYRFAVLDCRFEPPSLHCINGGLVKIGAERPRDCDIAWSAVRTYNKLNVTIPS